MPPWLLDVGIMNLMDDWLVAPQLQPILILALVLLIERRWHWPEKYHPLGFARLIALRMAQKVNHKNSAPMQLKIAGTLAPLVLLTPFIIIMVLFIQLAEFPLFFDGILLLVAMQTRPVTHGVRKVSLALQRHKKALARDTLSPLCLRDTSTLSEVGIVKTSIETLVLRFCYQTVAVMFWYLLLGGVGALSYRLVYEFAQIWNRKLSQYQHFGAPISALLRLLNWLPVQLFIIAFMLAENIRGALRALRGSSAMSSTHNSILAACGGALGIQLGGPVIYQQQKRRFAKLGTKTLPAIQDIDRALKSVSIVLAILLILSFLVSAITFAMRN
ncbi:cobalamin biosynthesis protein [Alteromonadaceae bacterium BrNp21-10]|nr:cobalamin biosynthesis protein [Alteromonadaceae bacterium BrNp21-10]